MARVFEVPRYKKQTANKLLLFMDLADLKYDRKEFLSRIPGCEHYEDGRLATLLNMFGETSLLCDELEDPGMIDYTWFDEHIRYCYKGDRLNIEKFPVYRSAGLVMHDILKDSKVIYTDHDAMQRLIIGYLAGDIVATTTSRVEYNRHRADMVAKDMMHLNVLLNKLSKDTVTETMDKILCTTSCCSLFTMMRNAADVMETCLLHSPSESIREAHEALHTNTASYEDFSMSEMFVGKHSGFTSAYRVMGLTVLKKNDRYQSVAYILDHSALMQVYQCLRFWTGAIYYFYNYRISGNLGDNEGDVRNALHQCVGWICDNAAKMGDRICRHMKLSYSLLQNNYCDNMEELNVNSNARFKDINADLEKVCSASVSWYELVTKLHISDRAVMDIAYLFHGLPCPDCDPKLMFDSVTKKLSCSNPVKDLDWAEFMNYSKTFDLCCLISRYKEEVLSSVKTVEGYEYKEAKWFKKCMKGTMTMPPDEDMGKAWVEAYFQFDATMNTWFYEASDVTHVMPDIEMYSSKKSEIKREDFNELLYALKHAPLIGYKYTPDDLRKHAITGEFDWDPVCVLASKAENTKCGVKIRETYSGADTLREITSEIDRTGIRACTVSNASTLRMSDVQLNKKMHKVADFTKQDNKQKVLIISLDVSGWSPNANRDRVLDHHYYVSRMSQIPEGYRMDKVWEKIKLVIDKRGYAAVKDAPMGMFQGFTGTLDTTLHQHLAYYAIRRCKREKLLNYTESAHTMVLIDDGTICIPLDWDRSLTDIQRTADRVLEVVTSTYASCGFIIDIAKTIYSTMKYTFLNRFFAHGSEVVTPMKVFSKIDREISQKFSTARDQISAVMTSGRSSCSRGSDPYVSYYYCLVRSLELLYMTNKSLIPINSDMLFHTLYAPQFCGGIGVPALYQWLSGESIDPLCTYLCEVKLISSHIQDEYMSQTFFEYGMKVVTQDFNSDMPITTGTNPYSINYKHVSFSSNMLHDALADKLCGYTTSSVFKNALQLFMNKEHHKNMSELIKSCVWDAAVLEEFLSTGPTEAIKTLLIRAISNELMSFILRPQERQKLIRDFRNIDKKSLMCVIGLKSTQLSDEVLNHWVTDTTTGYEMACLIRSRFNEERGLRMVNHTRTDVLFSMAHSIPTFQDTIQVSFEKPKNIKLNYADTTWTDPKDSICNLYDNFGSGAKFLGSRSRGIIDQASNSYRAMDIIQKSVFKCATLCAYVSDHGNDGGRLWEIMCAMWGVSGVSSYPSVSYSLRGDASTKRLSSKLNTRSHTIACYPNSQGCITVDASCLARFLDTSSVHVDYMSYVTTLRCVALLDMAGLNKVPLPRSYNIVPNTLPQTNTLAFEVIDMEEFESKCKILADTVPNKYSEWFTTAMGEYRAISYDEESDGIELQLDEMAGAQQVVFIDSTRGFIMPGTMGSVIGLTSTYCMRRVHVRRKDRGNSDIAVDKREYSAIHTYRELVRRDRDVASSDTSSAAFSALAAETRKFCLRKLPDEFYTTNWSYKSLVELAGKCFKQPIEVFNHLLNLSNSSNMRMTKEFLKAIMPRCSHTVIDLWVRGGTESDKKYMLSIMLLCTHGRFCSPRLYSTCALIDKDMIRDAWSYAMKRQNLIELQARKDRDDTKRFNAHFTRYIYKGALHSLDFSRTAVEFIINMVITMNEAIETLDYRKITHPDAEPVRKVVYDIPPRIVFSNNTWHNDVAEGLSVATYEASELNCPPAKMKIKEVLLLAFSDLYCYHTGVYEELTAEAMSDPYAAINDITKAIEDMPQIENPFGIISDSVTVNPIAEAQEVEAEDSSQMSDSYKGYLCYLFDMGGEEMLTQAESEQSITASGNDYSNYYDEFTFADIMSIIPRRLDAANTDIAQ